MIHIVDSFRRTRSAFEAEFGRGAAVLDGALMAFGVIGGAVIAATLIVILEI